MEQVMPVQTFSHDRWYFADVDDRRARLCSRHRLGNLAAGILGALAVAAGTGMVVLQGQGMPLQGPDFAEACAGMLGTAVIGTIAAVWASRKARAIEALDEACRELDLNEIAALTNIASSHKDIARALLSWVEDGTPVQRRDFLAAKAHAAVVEEQARIEREMLRQNDRRSKALAEMERVARVASAPAPAQSPTPQEASNNLGEFPDTAERAKRRIEAAVNDYTRLLVEERLTHRQRPGREKVIQRMQEAAQGLRSAASA